MTESDGPPGSQTSRLRVSHPVPAIRHLLSPPILKSPEEKSPWKSSLEGEEKTDCSLVQHWGFIQLQGAGFCNKCYFFVFGKSNCTFHIQEARLSHEDGGQLFLPPPTSPALICFPVLSEDYIQAMPAAWELQQDQEGACLYRAPSSLQGALENSPGIEGSLGSHLFRFFPTLSGEGGKETKKGFQDPFECIYRHRCKQKIIAL